MMNLATCQPEADKLNETQRLGLLALIALVEHDGDLLPAALTCYSLGVNQQQAMHGIKAAIMADWVDLGSINLKALIENGMRLYFTKQGRKVYKNWARHDRELIKPNIDIQQCKETSGGRWSVVLFDRADKASAGPLGQTMIKSRFLRQRFAELFDAEQAIEDFELTPIGNRYYLAELRLEVPG